jgi:hypothetical protein
MPSFNQPPTTDDNILIGGKYKSQNKGYPHSLIICQKGENFPTQELAETESEWLDRLKRSTGRHYLLSNLVNWADNTGEPVKETFPQGGSRSIRASNYEWYAEASVADSALPEIYKLNNKSWDTYIIWNDKSVEGYTDVNKVIFYPKRLDELLVGPRTLAEGTVTQKVKITLSFAENDDFELNSATVYPSFDLRQSDSVKGVRTEASNPGAGSADVLVKDDQGVGQKLLVSGDFVASTSGPLGLVDNGGGSYSLTGVGAGSTTFTLVDSDLIENPLLFIESRGLSNAVTVS